ncbi:MAG: BamA/TamA family outer membrane protein [Chitinophagaceae bacterium]
MQRVTNYFIVILSVVVSLAIVSCSNTRHLPPGDALYLGSTIKLHGPDLSRKKKKPMRAELSSITRPRPNKTFLGIRFKLFFYNLVGNREKKTGPLGWLKYTVGEPPVLLSDVRLEYNSKVLQNTLENEGYFKASVTGDTSVRRRKARAIYSVETGAQYKIKSVTFNGDSTLPVDQRLMESSKETVLKPGDPFNLAVIKVERDRIDNHLKENGYYYFSPDFLIIQTDSTIGNNQVDLFIKIKKETPQKAKDVFTINDVVIMPNYRLNAAVTDTGKQNATFYKGYYVVDKRKIYKPSLFEQSMQFKSGEVYNRTDHNLTINRLVTLGMFKFVKNRFEEVPNIDSSKLDAYYYLTPMPKKSIRGEINGNTKSNNLTGSSVTIGWRNRNTFRGGELLTIDATGGFEVQYSGALSGFNTFRTGIETSLTFPRFMTPFFHADAPGGFVPKTKLTLGYDILMKQKLYTMNSFRAEAGYIWKESLKKEHQLNPISITYVQPIKITQLYTDSIAKDPTLEKAVEKQFILGSNYNYTYNGITDVFQRGFYFSGTIDISGNVAGLLSGASQSNPKFLFGAQFAQYVKFETDMRYYAHISPTSALANRIIIGAGLPYGNSSSLPFIKQFFVGGNNSIRAFRSRSLGPGTYQALETNFLPDQSGDIKLEMNTELRAKLYSIVHGAVFVDAGNIWLFNKDPLKPGGEFTGDFLNQLAVGTGVGLRFDISFLVLRFDVAFPLRKPYLPKGQQWVIDQINFGSGPWRRDNLVFNLGIGYPF